MTVLLLTLAGPLQSWGASSRFVRRGTEPAPTKSGVVGLIAAAQGRRRTDPIEDLAGLRFGVRIDQPGRLVRDFQTEQRFDGSSLPLSYRFYLADAVFLVGLEGDTQFLEGLADAIRRPIFPLFLGRRSCPPAGPLVPLVVDGTLEEVFRERPWAAASWYRRSREVRELAEVRLETITDARSAVPEAVVARDHPVSFDPESRRYGWRTVVHDALIVPGPAAGAARAEASRERRITHDPMAVFDG